MNCALFEPLNKMQKPKEYWQTETTEFEHSPAVRKVLSQLNDDVEVLCYETGIKYVKFKWIAWASEIETYQKTAFRLSIQIYSQLQLFCAQLMDGRVRRCKFWLFSHR